MRILVPTVLASLFLTACPSKPTPPPTASATPSPTATATASPVPTADTGTTTAGAPEYALVVSFYSPGNGTDAEAFARLEKLIAEHPKKPSRTTTRWGREGEHDECFTLQELGEAERAEFIAAVKKSMSTSNRVNINEKGECSEDRGR